MGCIRLQDFILDISLAGCDGHLSSLSIDFLRQLS